MSPLAQAISGALLQFVWQGFLVAFVASLAMFVLRRQGPQIRYLVCCVAMLLLAALPVVTAIALYDPLSGMKPGAADLTLTIRGVWANSASPLALSLERWLDASRPWILRVWMLGVAFLSLRLAWLGARVSSLRRSGRAPGTLIVAMANAMARRMGMRRAVRVLVSAIPEGPSVVGWIRPVILLPAATILNLTPEHLEAILAHEIAHLRRYDDVVNIAQSVIETVLFYHPAVWWVSSRIRQERELCCDDLAARASGNALCYARALTTLERLRMSSPGLALGALGNTGSPLEHRIRRLVDDAGAAERSPAGVTGFLALGLVVACLAIYSSPADGSAPPRTRVEYPEAARIRGIQGTVAVEVKIDDLGSVSDAKALGGPRELRQAAVKSVAALHFAPDTGAGTEQVNVAFQLIAANASAPVETPAPALPVRTGPRWRDRGESVISLAAGIEKDAAKQLALLREWEQLYPVSELRVQRELMTANALLAVLGAAYGKTDPALLDAGKRAGRQLVDQFNDYLMDSASDQLQLHAVLAYIAQTEHDFDTAEAEMKMVLTVDPDDAGTSYQLGATILQEIATNNELTRYSEAIYNFARSLAVTGPTALPPEMKAAAENALKESYGSYHGSTDGLEDLLKQVGTSALPPADFHIASRVEVNDPARKTHADWEAAKAALLDRGGTIDPAALLTFRATVVSQLSLNRILVNVDNAPAGDAVLRFDASKMGAVRPGTAIQFTGIVDSFVADPYIVTFVIRNPKTDIAGLGKATSKRGNVLARRFNAVFRMLRRLA